MTSLVEQFGAQLGWQLARNNVLVEGTSDVTLLSHVSKLHADAYGRAILDNDFAIIAAGRRDDGGVDGVKRRLTSMREMAEADRDAAGRIQHHFIGLFDNDFAGRTAFNVAPLFDRRIEPYVHIFLLHPILPPASDGILDPKIQATHLNLPYAGMDWEIEDLFPERIMLLFERENPGSIIRTEERNGRTHREIQRLGKPKLTKMFVEVSTIEDCKDFILLLKSLRSYFRIDHEFIGFAS